MWFACLSRKVILLKIAMSFCDLEEVVYKESLSSHLCTVHHIMFCYSHMGSPHIAKVRQEVDAQRQNGDDDNEEEDKGEDENENNEDTGTSIILHVTQIEYFAYRLHSFHEIK